MYFSNGNYKSSVTDAASSDRYLTKTFTVWYYETGIKYDRYQAIIFTLLKWAQKQNYDCPLQTHSSMIDIDGAYG